MSGTGSGGKGIGGSQGELLAGAGPDGAAVLAASGCQTKVAML